MSQITYTHLTEALCEATAELIDICFPDMPAEDQLGTESLQSLARLYPQGQIIALDGSRVVGMGTGVLLDVDPDNLPPREHDLIYPNDQNGHALDADYYYGTDLAVHPDYQGRGIAREIYRRRKAVVVEQNKRGFYAAAVLPGFAAHRDALDIHGYVDRVIAGKLFDPTLSVQLRNGFQVVRLVHEFFIFPRSDNWCALIYWENESYAG